MFKCLLANDEPLQLLVWKMLFDQLQFETYTAQNGFDAFTQVEESLKDGKKLFDLVLLDLHMPVSDGYEACSDISKLFDKKQIKIGDEEYGLCTQQDFKPMLVACSSYLDEKILQKTESIGFDRTFQNPLSLQQI